MRRRSAFGVMHLAKCGSDPMSGRLGSNIRFYYRSASFLTYHCAFSAIINTLYLVFRRSMRCILPPVCPPSTTRLRTKIQRPTTFWELDDAGHAIKTSFRSSPCPTLIAGRRERHHDWEKHVADESAVYRLHRGSFTMKQVL